MNTRLVASVGAAAVVAVVGGSWLLDDAGILVDTSPSENQALVERDPSWLGYLPVPRGGVDPVVTGMGEADSATHARRVDLVLEPSRENVSLCFSATEEDAELACGEGTALLGHTDRDVDLPWVSLIGETDANLLDHLQAPTPTLDDVPSVKE